MSDQLGKMKLDDEKYIEAAIWCLHYTECVMGLIEDWEARKNKIEEGIDLMKVSGFGEKAKIEQGTKQKFKNEQRTDEEAKMEEEIDEEVKMEEEVNTEEGIDLKKIEDKAERGSLLEHFQYNLLCTLKKNTEMSTHLTRLFWFWPRNQKACALSANFRASTTGPKDHSNSFWATANAMIKPGVPNTRARDYMWPARAFCAARDALWEFSNN